MHASDVLYDFAVTAPAHLGSGPGTLGAHLANYTRRHPELRDQLAVLAAEICRDIIDGDDGDE